jgi:hypothetical protein
MLKKIVRTIWINLPPSFRRMIVRATQPTFTVSVAAIIINEKGEVLLLDHVLRSRSSWGVPGGFLAHGEQPVAAVQRELREETGIEITSAELFRVRTVAVATSRLVPRRSRRHGDGKKPRDKRSRLVQTGRDAEKYESIAEAARRKFIEKLVCD